MYWAVDDGEAERMMTYEAYFDTEAIRGWYPVEDSRVVNAEIGLAVGLLRYYQNPTLTNINKEILSDNSLSDEHKTALIELMRVAYETVTK